MKKILLLFFIFTVFFLARGRVFAEQSWISKVSHPKYNGTITLPHYNVNDNNLRKELDKFKKEEKKQKKIKYGKKNSKINAAVKKTLSAMSTSSFNRKITFFAKQMLGKGEFGKYVPKAIRKNYIKFLKSGKPFAMQGGKRVFLLISSSVPFKTLRRYVLQIADNNLPVQMILRGLIPGSHNGEYFMSTIKYIESLIKYKDKSGYYDMHIDIDPLVFAKFNVHRVPALIYVRDYNPQTFTSLGEQAYLAYGNDDLEYLLKQIEDKTKSVYIKRVILTFRKNQFFK